MVRHKARPADKMPQKFGTDGTIVAIADKNGFFGRYRQKTIGDDLLAKPVQMLFAFGVEHRVIMVGKCQNLAHAASP